MSQNLSFRLGTTWGFDVDCVTPEGNPLNLAGATIKWRVTSANGVEIEVSLNDGIEIDGTVAHRARVDVTKAMQGDIVPAVYDHAMQVIDADGAVSEQIAGTLLVEQSPFSQFA